MADERAGDVTQLLVAWGDGDAAAFERLVPIVYDELRRLARSYIVREGSGNTLQPTALVHEAYLKLIDQRRVQWKNRAHFFGVAAQAMRRILVDRGRARIAAKRGGRAVRIPIDGVSIDDVVAGGESDPATLLALDSALTRLSQLDPTHGRLVELRYFGGLTIEETAHVLGTSPGTVKREWRVARAWLNRELRTEGR
jgi:RNA polymerase sigma factor (TIGR02999 family)